MTYVVTYPFLFASKLQEQLLSSRVLPNNFQLQKKKLLYIIESMCIPSLSQFITNENERDRGKKNERTETSDSNLLFPVHFFLVPVCLDTAHKHRQIRQGEIIHPIQKVLWVESVFRMTNFLRTRLRNMQKWNGKNVSLYDS